MHWSDGVLKIRSTKIVKNNPYRWCDAYYVQLLSGVGQQTKAADARVWSTESRIGTISPC